MAVARHPVARIAPPAPAIISASRARVGERDGERGNFPLILQCRQTPPPFRGASETERSQRSPSRTTRMSLGGGECRVGRAAPWDHHRRRGAESSPIVITPRAREGVSNVHDEIARGYGVARDGPSGFNNSVGRGIALASLRTASPWTATSVRVACGLPESASSLAHEAVRFAILGRARAHFRSIS